MHEYRLYTYPAIGDRGACAVDKFLNLYDNLMQYLTLRLNRLGDIGRALLKNRTLIEVNLVSNDLVEPTATLLSQVVIENQMLHSIDLSCNRLGQDGGKLLQEDMKDNPTIILMDLRLTECGQESENCINQILHRNQEADRESVNAQYKKSNMSLRQQTDLLCHQRQLLHNKANNTIE
ncbi:hypothetical protein RRG08_054382 [Elysia crispata]|uniref:Uncharacterized protein n=1 Tax=Elysia crispata TaxID=231223 RepID=A0AAE1B5K8_9GAST|nr:hypothetical protein RRG08_054382 [Elysia crispata]